MLDENTGKLYTFFYNRDGLKHELYSAEKDEQAVDNMTKKAVLSPSILAADFANLGSEIALLHKSKAEYIHIDIMDGVFVPSSSFGTPVMRAIRKYTDKIFDVHLMVQNPDSYIEPVVQAGADLITVHAEASVHLHRSVQLIKKFGKKAGVALNPSTPIQALDYVLEDLDMVLLMTVDPGFGGQSYIESITGKISRLRSMIAQRDLKVDIEVDGGISPENVRKVLDAGANIIVAGSSVFGKNTLENIDKFYSVFKENAM
jgi:ribulose-phosphate 3-epimerase